MKRISVNAIAVLAAVSVSACATTPMPDYPPDHPANAAAAASPPAAASQTLVDYKSASGKQELAPAHMPEDGKDGQHDHR